MSKRFSEYNRFNLSDINKEILEKWDKENIFQQSLDVRAGAPSFVFYEGPPSANGMPGIHHVIARTVKDIFCRYKTMKGFLVNRKAGWDTHGLPVELAVEKKLGITKEDIGKKISVKEYNDACRKEVMKYTGEWENLTRIMGYWVDMNDPYVTYDSRYIETLWFLLKELYKKGYLYKGYTIQPYSPAAGTGLSTHELNQPGAYRDVKDTTCVAQFKIKSPKAEMAQFGDAYFLAWTTTPWTLPSNTALAVGGDVTYVAVQTYNPYTGQPMTAVMAKSLVFSMFNEKAQDLALEDYKQGDKLIPYKIVGEWSGKDLAGMEYEQLIPWMNPGENAFKVLVGDFVTTEDGTGIVHIAPTFGADDARVAKANDVPALLLLDKDGNQRPMVDLTGKYFRIEDLDPEYVKEYVNVDLYKEYAGRYVKNEYDDTLPADANTLDIDLSVMLKQQNQAFKIERQVHNYPHCWRTDKPVLYYPLDSWFIRTTGARERLIELNKTINWKPESTGTGRFGKWLENLQDWNLSRSRYWGTPLPIWRTEDGKEEKCIGSVKELYEEMQKAVDAGFMKEVLWKDFQIGNLDKANYEKIDLHRPYVDDIILVSDSGQPMTREKDLIDVWFDSGAMPFAQVFYPNISEEEFNKVYPADFIAEGVDQTRGWFYTLHAISTMFKDSISFKNVISNGLVLDKNGNKMSKSKGNVINPFEAIEQYGSDPLRWYMITNASPWDNLKFDIEGVEEVRRKFFGTLYNTYSFFALYANVDGFTFSEELIPVNERPEIDRWIISLLNTLVKDVDENLNAYEPTKAGRAISDFVNDNLSNWYVRLNRKRFWGGEMTKDKLSAYQTLYTCLETVAKLMAPISPFYADRLFRDLTDGIGCEDIASVHLTDFPAYDSSVVDKRLEERMQIAQDISSAVLALRRKESIKVRQPLMQIMIPVMNEGQRQDIEAVRDLILTEVNVKELNYVDNAAGILVKKVKPDFKKLGPRYGKIMKQLAAEVQAMPQEAIAAFEKDGNYSFDIEGQTATIELADVEIISEDIPGWLVANAGKLTVALDVTITDDLRKEGIARELVNRIQNIRKSGGLDITDRIVVKISDREQIRETVSEYNAYISSQVLADKIELTDVKNGQEIDMDDYILQIEIAKV
ncbi:isoleucyl-tRNA synthetase [Dysgonomonas sp. PFB1-18]|uniref:isoleucine--tRNA ligase n=1 Tax=unclassified Dysgonomonas TaxID=2630389 RepID=UPI002475ADB2|nr:MULTISPECIES: isoleucine--tRNA ligase [unclassified Dysgonomonas]MDL2303293.1 isoleucine--tRNA ligase [Dysgonomonas sp. OttesenSCG-928-D17]MDH6309639.1 isoleucyl-tRNA synthetase [Dysgonomonas sp. PF1-14]MDH6339353.1 isoleucyl-tRNA synthetase [Dysgonomonas sp. PF1-16]MDH6380852.1 isoleucyl-tRNA synthetase [Dysgonomonas sp. PFB1-18]MDH6398348.1 isoleucyl-tRNA synthetase [Dysgonomonas sp. PF1-23]